MKKFLIILATGSLLSFGVACKKSNTNTGKDKKELKAKKATKATDAAKQVTIDPGFLGAFKALPAVFESKENALSEEKINLGRMLFFDKRLSKNHDVSCNSCHMLDKFGVDSKQFSSGHKGKLGGRNSPTVYNAAGHFVQFWDGRSPHVEHQATQPILNPVEMAMKDGKEVMAVVKTIPGYVTAFKKAFPKAKKALTYENLGKAIGAFERKLVTPSPWDKYLKGDKKALTNEQKQGFIKFVQTGCTTCHSGVLVGGHIYQKLGLVKVWPKLGKDTGRHQVTKKDADKYFFKAPSLRNIEKTGPYLHDGSIKSLDKVVSMMAEYQMGRKISKQDVALIVAWLKTLTGSLPTDYIKEPKLPASSKKTPKPNPK